MATELARRETTLSRRQGNGIVLPAVIAQAGEKAGRRFVEFFTANIRNPNTRTAYARAAARFLEWCDERGMELAQIEPVLVAAYIEEISATLSRPTVKQHLAALKMLFDWLTTGGVIPFSPAASVRGPKHVVKKGTTPVLKTDEARTLLDSIRISREKDGKEIPDIKGLRDRALIAVMVYSFARVGAALGMKVEDYYSEGRRGWFRLHEKGGKLHSVPAHHNAEAYLDAYLEAAGIAQDRKEPLFRTIDKTRKLTRLSRTFDDDGRFPTWTQRETTGNRRAFVEPGGLDHQKCGRTTHKPPDGPKRRPSDDKAKSRGGRALTGRVLSHVPSDGYNGLPRKRWHN